MIILSSSLYRILNIENTSNITGKYVRVRIKAEKIDMPTGIIVLRWFTIHESVAPDQIYGNVVRY